MPLLKLLFLAACFSLTSFRLAAPEPVLSQQSMDVPKGEVRKYVFSQSKIFPGTVRDYWVYVPQQYDPAKPACVYVNQDGIQFNAPAVFDELIHKKEMPITIGVFITPGKVKATSPDALDRFNRSFEYDSLGDKYVRFLLEELLPEVEKKTTQDGRPLRLSKEGNDRCIGGSSSGAVCAFTAAWERPDAFRRVFSAIGTYVGLRGGHNYPTMIRKTEPKPLRVFLQDGSSDLNIYGGDWWMANQEMERALTFAGYEVKHVWGTGGHNGNDATKLFPEAMRWLWKDWPTPIKAGIGSPQLREILLPGEGWQQVLAAEGMHLHTLAVNAQGEVFVRNLGQGRPNWKLDQEGKLVPQPGETRCLAQAFGPDGRRYVLQDEPARLLGIDGHGTGHLLADNLSGTDLIVRHDGKIYVTKSDHLEHVSEIWEFRPTGDKRLLDKDLFQQNQDSLYPASVALSPDQSLLYVGDGRSHWVFSYQIQPDGTLAYKQRFYHLHVLDITEELGTLRMQVDREGRLYVCTRLGLQVCDQAGRVNCLIPSPHQSVSSLCFGGPQFDTLYVTSQGKLYKRKVKVQGANAFQAPLKPKPPRL